MASSSHQVTTNHRQRYQGYPHVNPPAFGVPSIDPETAARWASLPRRPIGLPVRVHDQAGGSGIRTKADETVRTPDSGTSTIKSIKSDVSDPDENPVVYIDLPDDNESDIVQRRVENVDQNKTEDLDDVVYIEMPEASGSELCERREECEEGPSASVVQETILFDQFKNRRIDIAPVQSSCGSNPEPSDSIPSRPSPPNTLNIYRGQDSSSQSHGPTQPAYLTPEEYRQRQTSQEDDFRLPPLPISSFPDPPPAYSEIDQTPAPVTNPVPVSTRPDHLADVPRTTVIVNTPTGNSNRKYMACKHCGMMVHSLVVKQISFLTHVIAISFFFIGFFPFAILVYCFGFFKSKQHYCPNCTKMMTSEDPFKMCC